MRTMTVVGEEHRGRAQLTKVDQGTGTAGAANSAEQGQGSAVRLWLWKQGHCSAQGGGGTGQGSSARAGRVCRCNLESGLGSEGAQLWLVAAAATGDGGSDNRCGSGNQGTSACVAVQVRKWLFLEGAGPTTGGSSCGYWRLRVWEEIGMKGFDHLPPLFINQWSN